MRTILVSEGQTVLDIAIEHCGSLSVVFEIAELNELESFTDELKAGQELIVPDVVDAYIVEQFDSTYKKPVSSDSEGWDGTNEDGDEGIDFWEIETEFEVQGDDEGIDYWEIETQFEVQ